MTVPIPIVVTNEMRQAVYAADCATMGHLTSISGAVDRAGQVAGESAAAVPFLTCIRCHKVWVVIDTPGVDYAAAIGIYNGIVTPAHAKDPKPPKPPTPVTGA